MIILLACGIFWLSAFVFYHASLFEQRRQARLAQRKEKLAHDEQVRRDYGYYNRVSFIGHTRGGWSSFRDVDTLYLSKEETQPIPTIEAENTDGLSDAWVNAIEELEGLE